MWQEIYTWIESYTGCTYDIDDSVEKITDQNFPFLYPFEWKLILEMFVDDLGEIYEVIDTYEENIPDTIPGADELKRMFSEKILGAILVSLNNVKRQLHIERVNITDHLELLKQVDIMYLLIQMLATNDMETIVSTKMFDRCNEECDNGFTDVFNIVSSDISTMHEVVTSIIDVFGMDEEDIDDMIEDDTTEEDIENNDNVES